MTEVPEHLLQRSRERRAALGLGGGDAGGGTEPAAAAETPAPADEAAPAVSPAAAEAPAVPEPAAAPPAPPPPPLPETRTGIPRWMMPVLVILPFWAVIYIGAFGTTKKAAPVALSGKQIYSSRCAVCHGASGEGVSAPALAHGDAKITFPNRADHVAWVESGSAGVKGKGYGDPNRAGGQRIAKTGGMPSWKGVLTDAQIQAVVDYERDNL